MPTTRYTYEEGTPEGDAERAAARVAEYDRSGRDIEFGEAEGPQEPLPIQDRFALHGFHLRGTGGNCTAYVRVNDNDHDDIEEWVTLANEASVPTRLAEECRVSLYTDSEWEPNADHWATCAEILAALDLRDDEYTLLWLKLYNGHHKRAPQPTTADTLFRNHYTCYECGNMWDDVWSARCDDTCPKCGAKNNTPTHSDDINDITTEGTAT